MTSEEASTRAVRSTFFVSASAIFFLKFQDSYQKVYLHDSRRQNDQKNSYLNIDFENGNSVIKKWLNTRENNLFTRTL